MERLYDGERLSGEEIRAERERLNLMSYTELSQLILEANQDILENPYRMFETLQTSTIAAQILVSRGFLIENIYE